MLRFHRCRFRKQNCKFQKKRKCSGIRKSGGAVEFLYDFGEAEVPFGWQMSG